MFTRSAFLSLVLVCSMAPAYAQGRGGQPPAPAPASQVESASRNEVAGPAEEKISQTQHSIRLGVRGDLRAFGEFINGYLKTYNRWPSPKFLIGESYGTIRSAGLSQELQMRHGIELNGIVLVSSLLTYQTLSPSPQNDVAYASHIETYTATAWYHKKLAADLERDLKKTVDEARTFAFGEYLTALAKGNRMTDAERKAMAQKVARYTGLSPEYVERAN